MWYNCHGVTTKEYAYNYKCRCATNEHWFTIYKRISICYIWTLLQMDTFCKGVMCYNTDLICNVKIDSAHLLQNSLSCNKRIFCLQLQTLMCYKWTLMTKEYWFTTSEDDIQQTYVDLLQKKVISLQQKNQILIITKHWSVFVKMVVNVVFEEYSG